MDEGGGRVQQQPNKRSIAFANELEVENRDNVAVAFSDGADEGDDAISLSSLSPPVFGADAEDNGKNDEVGDRNGHVQGNRCDRKIQRHRRRRRRER